MRTTPCSSHLLGALTILLLIAQAPPSLAQGLTKVPDAPNLGAEDFQNLAQPTPSFAAGGVEVVVERYPDGKPRIERHVVLDLTGNYVNHGEWKHLAPKGEIVAQGHFEMGKRIGPWAKVHSPRDTPILNHYPFNKYRAPFQSTANFIDDQIDGEWLILDSTGRKCMQVSLSRGKRNGVTTVWLPNGNVYSQATYENNIRVGDVMEADSKGQLKRIATYVDGRSLTTRSAKGRGKHKKSEEQYLGAPTVQKKADDFWTMTLAEFAAEGEELRHGPSTIWFDNGQLQQQGYYQHGKKHGTFTFYYENGQVAAAGEYRDDQPDGMWVWSHRNGQKATVGQYTAGQQVGDWRWWNDDGTLASEKTYGATGSIASDSPIASPTDLPTDLPAAVDISRAPDAPIR
jgi:antitoxin component YwqK of YwqJK toxin-antitoxin module